MSLLQAPRDVTAADIPAQGGSDLVRAPRAALLRQHAADTGAIDPVAVRKLLDAGDYTPLPVPAVTVYRIQSGTHSQTGLVVEASVRDYREGRIRRHEATDADRERHLDVSTAEAGFEQLPVALTHPSRERLATLLEQSTSEQPLVDLGSTGEARHTVWTSTEPELIRAVQAELATLDTLYIVDGHHRMAAAERYSSRRSRPGSAFTLATLFPQQQLHVLGYSRTVPRPSGYGTADLVDLMAELPGVNRVEPATGAERPGPGEVTVHIDGCWYRMRLAEPTTGRDIRDRISAVVLDEQVLPGLTGTLGFGQDSAATPLPTGSLRELSNSCAERGAIGFTPCPPDVATIVAVADAGRIMPPKSTWFEPKVSRGLFVREIG